MQDNRTNIYVSLWHGSLLRSSIYVPYVQSHIGEPEVGMCYSHVRDRYASTREWRLAGTFYYIKGGSKADYLSILERAYEDGVFHMSIFVDREKWWDSMVRILVVGRLV